MAWYCYSCLRDHLDNEPKRLAYATIYVCRKAIKQCED